MRYTIVVTNPGILSRSYCAISPLSFASIPGLTRMRATVPYIRAPPRVCWHRTHDPRFVHDTPRRHHGGPEHRDESAFLGTTLWTRAETHRHDFLAIPTVT